MSTYWTIRCVDCAQDLIDINEANINGAGQGLHRFIREDGSAIAELGKKHPHIEVVILPDWGYSLTMSAGKLAEHAGHYLVAWNEYGEQYAT